MFRMLDKYFILALNFWIVFTGLLKLMLAYFVLETVIVLGDDG